ncbi:MAG: MFS transporter, partial [Chloroflexi bacterium]|nr:MFS transporter [Chloroflexota bacterium]
MDQHQVGARPSELLSPLRGAASRIRKTYYGWWVALTGAVNALLTSGPTFQGSSAIFTAVEAEFGWSRALVSGVASFGRVGGALLGPLEGYFADRIGPARITLIGLIVGGFGFILFSQIRDPFSYYGAYIILASGFSFGGFTPAVTAVNSWMRNRRATGISIVVAGSSLGGLLVPALAWGITAHGWRMTSLGIGVVAILSAPIFYWLLSKKPPVDQPGPRARPGRAQDPARPDFTAGEAFRTRAFWLISISHTLANLSTATISAHVVLHLTDIGLSLATASTVVPVFAAVGFTFQIVGGLIGDRMDKRYPASVFLVIQAAGMVVLAFTTSFWLAMLFAVLWGIGFGGRTPMLHAMRGDYFGSKAFGTILGLSSLPMAVGMTATPVLVGLAFDIQG